MIAECLWCGDPMQLKYSEIGFCNILCWEDYATAVDRELP